IADELSRLQDRVPPFSGSEAQFIVEKAYGKLLGEVFKSFDPVPIASASIAQVHSAELFNGDDVVVKVVRPNMRRIIDRDINLLYSIARLAEKYWIDGKRLRPVEVVAEFEKS